MSKGKKDSLFVGIMRGSIISLLLYLVGCLLTALLLVKGILQEGSIYPVLAVNSVLASLSGCTAVLGKASLGKIPMALLVAGIFCCFQVMIGVCFWHGITWTGEGGVLLLCAVCGGILSALLSARKRKKGKRLRK